MKRPTWDEYFMLMVDVVKRRADCIRGVNGAVIVQDKRIMASGYNGTPHNIPDCSEGGCLRCQKREKGEIKRGELEESCVCIHAEQNAIIQAAYLGVSTKRSTLFASSNPCSTCAKMIINAGIKRVVCREEHHDLAGMELLKKAGVIVEVK